MGRQNRYRQKRHEQVHSLKSKSLYGLLITEFMQKQNLSQKEAEIVADLCFRYFNNALCEANEGQISYEVIDGTNNHNRGAKESKEVNLTVFNYSDIELLEEFGVNELQMNRVFRMIEQAYQQGGLVNYTIVCSLVAMTKKTLRSRIKKFWEDGIRCPLSGMASKYRQQMSEFRQARAIRRYLDGDDVKEIRKDLCISKAVWKNIYYTFFNLLDSEGSISELSAKFNIPEQLVEEYLDITEEYDISEIQKRAQDSKATGDVTTRKNFIKELENYCGFFPALAERVEQDLRELAREISNTRCQDNEIVYYAVSDQEPAGKPLSECELIPVHIEYTTPKDQKVFEKEGVNKLKWQRALRYATQCRYQGALLNQIDLSFLIGISPAVLQRLTKEHDKTLLPTRGNMVDMGPAVSHAEKIIGLYLQGYTETQVKRKTGHELTSIERYLEAFIKVVGLLEFEGLNPAQIRKVMGCSRRLVDKYLELYHEYNTAEYQWFMNFYVRNRYKNKFKKKQKRR